MSEETTDLQHLIQVDAQPASVSVNFSQLSAALDAHLAEYNEVVTADGVKTAKQRATEINKLKGELARMRKESVERVSAPIRTFEGHMKELEQKCEDTRQGILSQIQKYEDETRDQVRTQLYDLRASLWENRAVDDEHRRAELEDLVKLSHLTAGGKLTKAAQDAVEERVAEDRARQDLVERRMLELKNRSYEHGLSAPLTRDHVAPFLEADDATYEAELIRILDAEFGREQEAKRIEREQAEREASFNPEPETPAHDDPDAKTTTPTGAPEPAENQYGTGPEQAALREESREEPVVDDKRASWTVRAVFETQVAAAVTKEDLEAELRRVLTKAGVTGLTSIEASRNGPSQLQSGAAPLDQETEQESEQAAAGWPL